MSSSLKWPCARTVLVDSHVHIHPAFDRQKFFDSAWSNFSLVADRNDALFVLCLTETQHSHEFERLRDLAQTSCKSIGQLGNWQVSPTEEPQSLTLSKPGGARITIIAGRQIVTREHLEVLALGFDQRYRDGQATDTVIHEVRQTTAVPIIPWGFGKWYGRRGRILTEIIRSSDSGELFLGDNSGRPGILPEPKHFATARALGIKILPGSDPLPFASQQTRAGRFGFSIPDAIDERFPWRDIRHQLLKPTRLEPYGSLENPFRFARNQVQMQWCKRFGGR